MLTTISKVLAVLVTVFSLGFLAIAGVAGVGGPNWKGIAEEELPEYQFTRSEGENPTWSVKNLETGQNVGSPSPVLAQKIVDAFNEKKQKQQTRITELQQGSPQQPSIPFLKQSIATTQNFILADIKSIELTQDNLRKQIAGLNQQVHDAQTQLAQKAQEAEALHDEAKLRRDDVFRLQNLVEELEADRFRIVELQRKLRDVRERYQGTINRLENRREQLKTRLAKQDSDKTVSSVPTASAVTNERS
ncbi:hypothetical protein [Thalassoroseus pseudoceratinae]|uniref:hypothetical protein n=1 Tax=Thalassoroseus pseudoceratinae TaxID=2713176 RepID=UPI00141F551E|nr:hypothetical protein [Thalassoroseus pseudoceratinae]